MRWRRWPNQHGGGASCHPSMTQGFIDDGITIADGRHGVIYVVEREAYVDVIHFRFES